MNFYSLTFLVFFTVFYAVYWGLLRERTRLRNVFLLAGSLFFFGWWDWRFVSLILLTVTSTYLLAVLTERNHRKLWTTVSVCLNIAILAAFKYFNFFVAQFHRIALRVFPDMDIFTLDILLPVGISFYTFQAIGYAVDVYRGRLKAERDFVDFGVFISFFPQLVAGPIERAASLLPQIKRDMVWDYASQVEGCRRVLWGLVKKAAVADPCGMLVSRYMTDATSSAMSATLGALFFSVQIYCDFSGYCDIAIGTGRLLGIKLTENFRTPYFSSDVRDFWRRWNISLMNWLRDYIYIPLGGSRKGKTRTCINILAVFFLSGLWHGASMHFVVWGIYWAILLVIYRLMKRKALVTEPDRRFIPFTLFWVVTGWVIFKSSTLSEACLIVWNCAPYLLCMAIGGSMLIYIASIPLIRRSISALRSPMAATAFALAVTGLFYAPFTKIFTQYYLWVFVAALFAMEWHTRSLKFPLESMNMTSWQRFAVYWGGIILVLTSSYKDVPFIYFQF